MKPVTVTVSEIVSPKYLRGARIQLVEQIGYDQFNANLVEFHPDARVPHNHAFRHGRTIRVREVHIDREERA